MTKRIDVVSLEWSLQKAYDNFISNPDHEAKHNLFVAITDLTRAIVELEGRRTKKGSFYREVDKELLVYEYAVYLLQRIMEERFVLPDLKGRDKFAWTQYIRLNLRHVLWSKFKKPRDVPLGDLLEILLREYCPGDVDLLDGFTFVDIKCDGGNIFYSARDKGEDVEVQVYKKQILDTLKSLLESIYTEEEIKNYLLQLLLLPEDKWDKSELKDFVKILTVLYKRLFERYHFQVPADIDTVLRSTLFLGAITTSEFNKGIFLSLDMQNLYRLSIMCGGESVYIPTMEEIEELIASSYITWKTLRGSDIVDAKSDIKKFGMKIYPHRLNKYIKSLEKIASVKNLEDEGESSSKPITLILLSVVAALHKAIQQTITEIERMTSSEKDIKKLVEVYKELSSMFETIQNSLLNMKKLMQSLKQEEVQNETQEENQEL